MKNPLAYLLAAALMGAAQPAMALTPWSAVASFCTPDNGSIQQNRSAESFVAVW